MTRRWILSYDKHLLHDTKTQSNYVAAPHAHEARVGSTACSSACAFYGKAFRLPTGRLITLCPGRCTYPKGRLDGLEIVWHRHDPAP